MFFKQTGYKPRTGSMSSQSGAEQASTASTTQPAQQAANTKEPGTAAQAGRRRSSTDQKYRGLEGHKRSSTDGKRQSFNDQSAQPGVLGQMWTNFTKGK
ncbi:hypothetical protein PMZ80_004478 [Knufia obscura]|uniref:Uncharacterized protein n=2 Tax=Knufia TaxID=430999 RepID=A0AAN8EBP9_9EURO|nr:hypothetical protein PMZ80_004478 [Knufia obscura]KAK5951644.1 hypothetical protein OHC33_007323 [Knufia fluminis]